MFEKTILNKDAEISGLRAEDVRLKQTVLNTEAELNDAKKVQDSSMLWWTRMQSSMGCVGKM